MSNLGIKLAGGKPKQTNRIAHELNQHTSKIQGPIQGPSAGNLVPGGPLDRASPSLRACGVVHALVDDMPTHGLTVPRRIPKVPSLTSGPRRGAKMCLSRCWKKSRATYRNWVSAVERRSDPLQNKCPAFRGIKTVSTKQFKSKDPLSNTGQTSIRHDAPDSGSNSRKLILPYKSSVDGRKVNKDSQAQRTLHRRAYLMPTGEGGPQK